MQDLPKGWAVCKLGDVIFVKNGYAFKSKTYSSDGIPLVRISDIQEGKISLKNSVKIPIHEVKKDFLIFDGDLLIAMSGATTGKMGVYLGIEPCLQNQRVGNFKIRSDRGLDSKFRNFLVFSLRKDIELAAYGGAQPNISASILEDLEVPLPPFNEQCRIVAKLEKLLAKVNSCGDRLDKIPTILKRFRQSVLAAACSGRLTADWRDQHPNVEPAQELLKRTQDERAAKATTTAQQKKIDEIYSYKESQDSDELPPNWSYRCLEKIAYSFNYGTSTKSSPSGDVPVLRMGNLQEGVIDWSDLVFTSDTAEISKYSLEPYTVLFNRTNSPELVGKTSIYLGERPAIFAGYLIRIIHVKECLNPKYLNYFLNSLQAKEYCRQVKTDGVSQSNINAQKLGKFEIPFCSLQEQEEIVHRVENLFQKCDQIEARYQKAKAYTDKLTQAILAKAFRGELVPQDPNDEPAEVLLERIKAEKAATTKPQKTTKKRGKKASSPQQTIPGME